MAARASVAAGPDPSESPESTTNGPVPEQNRSPGRRRGRPNPFALPPPLRKTGPRPPQQHSAEGPFTRRRPPPTPRLQHRNPTPSAPMDLRSPPRRSACSGIGDRHGGTGDRASPECGHHSAGCAERTQALRESSEVCRPVWNTRPTEKRTGQADRGDNRRRPG